jgi:hypothetical protein
MVQIKINNMLMNPEINPDLAVTKEKLYQN